MRRISIVIFFAILTNTVYSAEPAGNLICSVLTVSPGDELYSTFGHTAIRIQDLQKGNDYVFNYGTFDFNTPDFYIKFALGKLDYLLSLDSFNDFLESCKGEGRSIKEQVLNFNKDQSLKLIQLLIENYKPQNRYYRYKFFTDNCSTRVRDIIVLASGDSLLLEKPKVEVNCTFRTLFTRYLKTMPWSRFGIELVLGKLTDEKAGYNSLFVPDDLQESINLAKISGKPLVSEEHTIVDFYPQIAKFNFFSPIFLAILILISTLIIQLRKQWILIYDKVYFSLFGILGLFIAFLSIFSEHDELHNNLVILFLLPTNIILPFLKPSSFRRYYCLIAFLIVLLGLILLPLLPQKFNFAFILLIVAMGIRYYFNILKKSNLTKTV